MILVILAVVVAAIVALCIGRQYEVKDNQDTHPLAVVTVCWSHRGAHRWIARNSYPGRCYVRRKRI